MTRFFLRLRQASLLSLSCALIMMSACTTIMPTKETVESRAMARWDAILSDDLSGAYEFLSPGYRSSVSSVQYQRVLLQNKIQWTNATYIESECAETTCNVKILLGYTVYGALSGVKSFSGTDTVEESWIKSDDKWYLVPQQ